MAKLRCKLCGDIIESKSNHDIKACKCGNAWIDGGCEPLFRRGELKPGTVEIIADCDIAGQLSDDEQG